MLGFGVEDQEGVFHDFVLETVDLDDCELLLGLRGILNAESWVVDDEFGW